MRNLLSKISKLSVLILAFSSQSAISGTKIVGGAEAVPYSYPFVVSIQYKSSGRHFCGGALISPNTVITAAHCTSRQSANRLQVVLAEHNLKKEEGVEQVRSVAKIINHQSYNSSTTENDIAIMHLEDPINISPEAQLITLPDANEIFSGKTTVIGWGRLRTGGEAPDELNEVDINIIDFEQCNADYNGKIKPGMLCAGAPKKDSCQGDSGGPLFQNNKLVGLTSWGYGCADPDFPGVYTEVSKYMDFINENILW